MCTRFFSQSTLSPGRLFSIGTLHIAIKKLLRVRPNVEGDEILTPPAKPAVGQNHTTSIVLVVWLGFMSETHLRRANILSVIYQAFVDKEHVQVCMMSGRSSAQCWSVKFSCRESRCSIWLLRCGVSCCDIPPSASERNGATLAVRVGVQETAHNPCPVFQPGTGALDLVTGTLLVVGTGLTSVL